ncbi:MAG: exosortase/archaeosortase family protein [Deltaproteobacteria bacterium]|nr:exosortase/archaeosortase family protein [Candidatus Anaeroferrophillacea bacterium]
MEMLQRHYIMFMAGFVLLAGVLYAPIVPGMVADWSHDPNYSHGFLVPFMAGWLIWQRRERLAAAPVETGRAGLVLVLLGLALLVFGWAGVEFFTMRGSLVVLLMGVVWFWFGPRIGRILFLPLAFLFFMVPLPYIVYDALAFPLKLFVTKVSVAGLKWLGVVVWREGNIIQFPDLVLEVADACSGLRSLVSLLALGVFYGATTLRRGWPLIVLMLLVVPIAVVSNIFRVLGTGLLSRHFGAAAAEGFFHEFAGLAVFVVAFTLLIVTGGILKRISS